MKKKLIWVMVLSLLTFGTISGKTVNASQGPAFLIENDYVIINYEKYELINNRITFDGLEYELQDNNFISYDEEGVLNVLPMPVAENQITDKAVLAELNRQIHNTKAVPSVVINPPYTKVVPAGQWNSQSPYINIRGGYTLLRVYNMPLGSNKRFSVHFIWGDEAGNWFKHQTYNDYDFGKLNYIKYSKFSTAAYGQFVLGNLYGTPGYTYTVSISK